MGKKRTKSTLQIKKGVTGALPFSDDAIKRFKGQKKKHYSVSEYLDGIQKANITILSKAITLIESALPEHHSQAQEIIEKCLPLSGKSIRIGITGIPGVGKSTFIESLGLYLTGKKMKLAVLAIDPSSERSGGSILGDKTRMESLSTTTKVFIRPSPTAGSLGGVARKTRETIILCEAAGYEIIFIETVGVGQSETAVYSMVDFFLLLMLAGAGDELQGIKRGIMEMADAVIITKADGDNIEKVERAKSEYKNALSLYPVPESQWNTPVLKCSALQNEGIKEAWETIEEYCDFTTKNAYFYKKRKKQARYWMYETIDEYLRNNFYNNKEIKDKLKKLEQDVLSDKISSFNAAKILLEKYFNKG